MQDSTIKLISVKCPDCGAALSVQEGRTILYCSYCGAKVLVSNENEHINRTIDEAEIKKAEADRDIKLKELENKDRASKRTDKTFRAYMIGLAVFMLILLVFLMIIVLK